MKKPTPIVPGLENLNEDEVDLQKTFQNGLFKSIPDKIELAFTSPYAKAVALMMEVEDQGPPLLKHPSPLKKPKNK